MTTALPVPTVGPEERYRKCRFITIIMRKILAIHHVSSLFTIRGHCPAYDITISYISFYEDVVHKWIGILKPNKQ